MILPEDYEYPASLSLDYLSDTRVSQRFWVKGEGNGMKVLLGLFLAALHQKNEGVLIAYDRCKALTTPAEYDEAVNVH